jgi:Holliday junction DNA helicase RuvA
LTRVLDEEVRLEAGPFEYQVLVPEFVRRALQLRIGQEVTLHTVPTEAELDFFDLFCTVDKVGTKKALKAMVRPVKEIADAIQRQDAKWLTTLPGIGPAGAEQIIATLRRKVTRFSFINTESEDAQSGTTPVDAAIVEDAYMALMALGNNPAEARTLLDRALIGQDPPASVEVILQRIYAQKS